MDINQVVLTGTISREPDAKYTKTGRARCHINVACDMQNPFGYPSISYIGVDGWNEVGEWMMENLEQGDQVLVVGCYDINSFEGTEGDRVYIHSVVASNIRNLSNAEAEEVEEEVEEEEEEEVAPPPKKKKPVAKKPVAKKPATRTRPKRKAKPAEETLDEADTPAFDENYE